MEAADNGLMPPTVAAAISRVKGAKQAGIRAGQWLTREQAENLLSAPDPTTKKGRRDRALLAVLIGCGLRRREASALTVDHIQLRDARWVIIDLIGKGGRVRTVPMPSWTKSAIDSWTAAAEIVSGIVFRAINKGGRVTGSITPRGIFELVQHYGNEIGAPNLAPHDRVGAFDPHTIGDSEHATTEVLRSVVGIIGSQRHEDITSVRAGHQPRKWTERVICARFDRLPACLKTSQGPS